MDNDNLYNLFQNIALGAIAMQSFTHGFHEIAKNKNADQKFPKLEYMFFVLPIVYNKSAMTVFGSSIDLYTAIMKDTSIVLGLQDRANKMVSQSFDAMNLALSKKILVFNRSENLVELGHGFKSRRQITLALDANQTRNSIKMIQECAHRLGNIFAKKNEKNIQLELNIRF
ncbi:three component ABC system middle component [Pedobacter psychrotolerans]|uniref:three component ABC system middle component n=1 Tax=Pedobacter psychrotolerans TaxID=1843235 RepID=UPI003F9D3B55